MLSGPDARLVAQAEGPLLVQPLQVPGQGALPEWGQYRRRAEALGIAIMVSGAQYRQATCGWQVTPTTYPCLAPCMSLSISPPRLPCSGL